MQDIINLVNVLDKRYMDKDVIVGLLWAKVTTPPSKDPLKLNRIKVNIPPMEESDQSDWVAPLSLGNAGGCGIYFPPKIDDEVMILNINGDIHQLFYISKNSYLRPPPSDHVKNDRPEWRWMIKTRGHPSMNPGHWLMIYDDPDEPKVHILSGGGADIIIDDKPGQRRIQATDHIGQTFLLDPEAKETLTRDICGNEIHTIARPGEEEIKLDHGTKDSHIHIQADGDVDVQAEETLWLNAKQIVIKPTQDLTTYIPPTTHTCKTAGIDYEQCPPPIRIKKCFNCETGEEQEGTPPNAGGGYDQQKLNVTEPASTWEITHNQLRFPPIQILDEDGRVIDAEIRHIDDTKFEINFFAPQTGTVVWG